MINQQKEEHNCEVEEKNIHKKNPLHSDTNEIEPSEISGPVWKKAFKRDIQNKQKHVEERTLVTMRPKRDFLEYIQHSIGVFQ